MNENVERQKMAELKAIADHYERMGIAGTEFTSGLRYWLAVHATDLNGTDCRFPSCSCPVPDCSQLGRAMG